MAESYKFVFESGIEIYLPIWHKTVNPDGTRTPIDLRTKRIVLIFTPRNASPLLVLDSDEAANGYGSKIEIADNPTGFFSITVTVAEIERLPKCFGRAEMRLYQTVGGTRELMDVPFSRI